jgi:hypothetical protein
MSGLGSIHWVSVSAGGNYVVLNHGNDNTSVSGSKVGSTWTAYGRPSHYDLAVDDQGEEVAVGVSKSGPDDGRVTKRRLRDGVVTVLTTGGYASHSSTRNLNRSGWAYSTYSGNTTPALYRAEIIAARLDGTRVERIAHHRGLTADYLTEQHGAPSPAVIMPRSPTSTTHESLKRWRSFSIWAPSVLGSAVFPPNTSTGHPARLHKRPKTICNFPLFSSRE